MKQSVTRVLALLLALIMAAGLLPTMVLAGGDEEPVDYASTFVSYPIAGEHPNLTGLAKYDEDPFTVDEVHFFELDSNGMPMGKFLDKSYTFVAGQEYACQVLLTVKPDFYFDSDLYGYVNQQEAEVTVTSDETAALMVYFTCAPGTVTVTFDSNGSKAAPPAPIQVPVGGCVWDAIRNFDEVRMPSMPWEQFYDWSLIPFANESYDYYSFDEPVYEDLTLYAMWFPCERTVELWVELPGDCMVNDVDKPIVTAPADANYRVYEPENFYIGLVDGHLHWDLIYMMPMQKGVTYYSEVVVDMSIGGQLPEVILHGAEVVSVEPIGDWALDIIFSVTPPSGESLTKASFFINTPRAGQSAFSAHPEVTCLTPGVNMGVQGWFDSPELGTEIYEDTLEGGKTYYALVYVGDDTGVYMIPNSITMDAQGKNVKLVRKVDLSGTMPNYMGAVVSVTIPRAYKFVADVPYDGGMIRCDREQNRWVATIDFTVEEGPITLEAKPDPEHLFKMWYDAKTYERLSKDAVYTFNLDRDVRIRASFVERPPFEDVGAWDYFYEPVMWAIHHVPVITGGTDDTHFSPKKACTREQIVTFLWKANGAPEPSTTKIPFTDVKPGKYYTKAVLWAVENGITGGVGDGSRFGVGQTCTREQAMTFLWKAKGSPEPSSDNNPFADVKAGKYYYKAILWAVNRTPQVTGGVGDGKFGVGQTCTRAQIITFLAKVYAPVG